MPVALRTRFQRSIEDGLSGRAAASRYGFRSQPEPDGALRSAEPGAGAPRREVAPRGKATSPPIGGFPSKSSNEMATLRCPNAPPPRMTQPAFERPPMPSGASRASLGSRAKNIRRHRTSPRPGKETARGSVPVRFRYRIPAVSARPAFAACVEKIPVPELEPGTHENAEAVEAMGTARVPVPVLAAIKRRPEPHRDRDRLLQTRSPPPPHRSAYLNGHVPCPCRNSANSIPRESAGTISRLPDMSQVKSPML